MTTEVTPTEIRAMAEETAARVISHASISEPAPPGLDATQRDRYHEHLVKIAAIHRVATERLRKKDKYISEWIEGDLYRVRRRTIEGLWVALKNNGVSITIDALANLLLNRPWDEGHQDWLDKALADEMETVVETKLAAMRAVRA